MEQMKFAFNYVNIMPPEETAVAYMCNMSDGKYRYKRFNNYKDVTDDYIPVGTVEFCEQIYKHQFTPEYYPDFLLPHLHRNVWTTDTWVCRKDVFIKPAHRYKAWNGKITVGGYRGKKKGPYWCSDKVQFISEWRYYVANGKVLFGEWYDGIEDDAPAYPFGDIPETYCGAIDIGLLSTGQMALVEANHPYGIGWYGGLKNAKHYFDFVIASHKYLCMILEKIKYENKTC